MVIQRWNNFSVGVSLPFLIQYIVAVTEGRNVSRELGLTFNIEYIGHETGKPLQDQDLP